MAYLKRKMGRQPKPDYTGFSFKVELPKADKYYEFAKKMNMSMTELFIASIDSFIDKTGKKK